ncbi:RNHCP domain-containing protein [Tengunoibacter tsumagoiensis]|uniref:RNHCP domain-containing protein n=1 Tax=Tengunoibacter tsumagoiensis TaxID=2014871 RepID=A0A401ZVT6_9CHLR|nr:RNHCP domain-containing protein [Tengunoibacter tsumagoiensis]GCE11011.1 RNHCP domain-containing protein [Tengunoibacter tsumagoiensis]
MSRSRHSLSQQTTCASQERYRRTRTRQHVHSRSTEEVFKCKQCRRFIGPLPAGGYHRNHCPFCLYSRHVDLSTGDRASTCGAKMEPIGYFLRPKGEYVLIHHCLGCGFERFNRIAADDNFELVQALPELSARSSQEVKLQRWQQAIEQTEPND